MKDKMTIIFFSGTMDKAYAMLMLSTTAAAMDMDVDVFFTFWGLSFLKNRKIYAKKGVLQKMMEFMMPKNMKSLPLATMNFLGLGPVMMNALMAQQKTPSVEELYKSAKELGVKFYACSTSCGIMGVGKDNMIPGVDDMVGAAAFLEKAKAAKINLFI
ncbi:MAG: DsrE/DsrF/DrsH-like family protein [Elusimicrobiota bacterium]